MLSTLAFIILALATGTAQSLGRQHWPVALMFWWFLIAEYALTRNISALATRAIVATFPVAIATASWAALHSRARTYLIPVFASLSGVAAAYAATRYGREDFGTTLAILSLAGVLVGMAAFYRSDAPSTTRTVLALLLGGLASKLEDVTNTSRRVAQRPN